MNYQSLVNTAGTIITEADTREKKIRAFGNLGYTLGYTWLQKKIHPKSKGGYMPRVPFFATSRKDRALSIDAHKEYKQRWVQGFNEYIKDKGLDLPLMEWS